MIKQFYFKSFNLGYVICLHIVNMPNGSIRFLDRTLSGVTTPSQSTPANNSNERVLRITEASLLDCLVPYPGYSFEEFYPTAEM